ncbi:MAG: flavin reductase family protein [Caulobacter sp.]|nr:flavin reductase family protein [Caulobacter sp.]
MSPSRTITLDGDLIADARALRDAFGCFTTGVTVVTTCAADGRQVGFTVNAFSSVSLDPPLALVCVDLKASSLPVLEQAGKFSVNVLHADQEDMARRFTVKSEDRFAGLECETWDHGVPILPGCMANFELETEQVIDAGDHRIFIGRILKVRFDPEHEPLVYLRGQFRRVHTD